MICPQYEADPLLEFHALFDDEAVVVASHNHPLFNARYQLRDLCQYRWALPATTVSARRWIDNAFQERNLPLPQVQIETTSISLLPRLVGARNLLCFLPRETLEDVKDRTNHREVMLKEITMKRIIVVFTRRNAYLSPAAQMLLGILKVEGAQFFDWKQVV